MFNPKNFLDTVGRVAQLSLKPRNFSQFRHEFKRGYKAKTFIPQKYEALPPWTEDTPRDPFDYPLRTIEEVQTSMKALHGVFQVTWDQRINVFDDEHRNGDNKNIEFCFHMQLDTLEISRKQMQRLTFLGGRCFDAKKNTIKVRSVSFADVHQNHNRVREIILEMLMEALRAPND